MNLLEQFKEEEQAQSIVRGIPVAEEWGVASLHLDWEERENPEKWGGRPLDIKLHAYTLNNKTDMLFSLYTSEFHDTKITCLKQLNNFLSDKSSLTNWIVRWKRTEAEVHPKFQNVSYFWAKNIKEVVDKFYIQANNPKDYIITSITVNTMEGD